MQVYDTCQRDMRVTEESLCGASPRVGEGRREHLQRGTVEARSGSRRLLLRHQPSLRVWGDG